MLSGREGSPRSGRTERESKHPWGEDNVWERGPWYVYILGSLSGTFYIGFTGRIHQRLLEHKDKVLEGFTAKYGVDRLLYYEAFDDPNNGIQREKQLKGWSRAKKIALIMKLNPQWKDLSREWCEDVQRRRANWSKVIAAKK